MYDFNPDLDLGDDSSVTEGVTYEIPAFFKQLAPSILDRAHGRLLTSSPSEYDKIIVDFQKTRRYGFTDEFVVNLLTDKVKEIHNIYPRKR